MGFGMTIVLLNLHNAGFFALGSMILAIGDILRWIDASNSRDNGVEKRQYIWNNGIHLLWVVLANLGRFDSDTFT